MPWYHQRAAMARRQDGRRDGRIGPQQEPSIHRHEMGEVVEVGPDLVNLRCLGSIEGPRWFDGRTQNGSVGLAPNTDAPFTETKWRVRSYPVYIDEPCGD